MDDAAIAQVLSGDLAAGIEEFRDELLTRCLSALDAGDESTELDEGLLAQLAAAGNPFASGFPPGTPETN